MRNYQDIVRAWISGDGMLASLTTSEQRRAIGLIAAGTATDAQLSSAGDEFVAGIKANLPHEIRQAGGPAPRAHEPRDHVLTWKFSDEKPDRMGDIIRLEGWNLDHYKDNPVVLWGHAAGVDSQADEPIGRTIDIRVQKDGLYGDILFAAEESDRAARIFRLAKSGFVQAGSVGFRPLKTQHIQDEEQRSKLGLGKFGVVFEESELLEFSLVAIPANANALQQSLKSGAIHKDDAHELNAMRLAPTERDCERLMRKKAQTLTAPVKAQPKVILPTDELQHAVRSLNDSLAAHTELASAVRALSETMSVQAELSSQVGSLAASLAQHADAHSQLALAITDLGGCIQTLRSSPASAPARPLPNSLRGSSIDERKILEAIEALRRGLR